MQMIVKAVSFIKSKWLNHHQFQEFLRSRDVVYGDIIYFSKVRLLTVGKTLKEIYDLQTEIKVIVESKGKSVPELEDEK